MTALAGVPLFPISAKTGEGIESLKKYLARTLLSKCTSNPKKIFGLSNSEIIQAINQAKTQASRIYPQSSDTLDPLTKRNILLDKIFVHPFLGPIIFLLVMHRVIVMRREIIIHSSVALAVIIIMQVLKIFALDIVPVYQI
jgi:Fe2+ transport system protein B